MDHVNHAAAILGMALNRLSEKEFVALYGRSKEEVAEHVTQLEAVIAEIDAAGHQSLETYARLHEHFTWLEDVAKNVNIAKG